MSLNNQEAYCVRAELKKSKLRTCDTFFEIAWILAPVRLKSALSK